MNNILTDVRIKTMRSLICDDPDNTCCIITVEKRDWADHILTLKGKWVLTIMEHLKVGTLINAHTVSTDKNSYKVVAIEYRV